MAICRYECIYTVALSLPYTKKADGSDSKNVPMVVALCSDILKDFVQDADQNLKCVLASSGVERERERGDPP
jgi:hypothetical protein